MKNWKTTLLGVLTAAAAGVAGSNIDPTITKVATVLTGILSGMIGFFAKDHDVTGGTRPVDK